IADRAALAGSHRQESSSLRELVGERASEVDPRAEGRLLKASDAIAALPLPFDLADDLPLLELRTIHDFVAGSVDVLETAASDAAAIARTFGLSDTGITVARALELAELAQLAADPARPEADWLNPAIVET